MRFEKEIGKTYISVMMKRYHMNKDELIKTVVPKRIN